MKLAILTFDFPPGIGGVQTYLYEVARRLSDRHEIMIITPGTVGDEVGSELALQRPSPSNLLGYWRALYGFHPDRVLVGHAHPQLLTAAALYAPARYAALAYGNDYLAAQARWHKHAFNWLLARSRPLMTISQPNAERLHRLVQSETVVIHPGTDPERFTPPNIRAPHSPILLTVGRLVPRKGIDNLLRALPKVLDAFPDLEYRIVGSGPDEPRLTALAAALGIDSAVRFMGRLSAQVLPSIYQDADIFVMPAREEQSRASIEGFGIVYLEASASGLPVIAGRSGGAVEAVLDGKTGYLVDPTNVRELADTILHLLDSPQLRTSMGARGRQWVEDKMNWDRAADELEIALGLAAPEGRTA